MASTIPDQTPRRGRPRSDKVRTAILAATAEILAGTDTRRVSIEAIAARAGVSKTTLYKWWATRADLILDSLASTTSESLDVTPGATVTEALTEHLLALQRLLTDPSTGGHVIALTAEALTNPDAARAIAERWVAPRRAAAGEILRRGIEAGEIRADIDIDLAADYLAAPSYYRAAYRFAPVAQHSAQQQVAHFMAGAAP